MASAGVVGPGTGALQRDWREVRLQLLAGLAALTREMSFVEHLEELRRRLIWSVVFIGAAVRSVLDWRRRSV